jgi:membrane protein required for colicin V production
VNLNWLDYLLILILGFSAVQSFRRGFSREVIGLIAAAAALFLGMWFYADAGGLLKRWIASDRAADFVGFVLVVLAVLVVGSIVGAIVRRFVKAVGLSFFDRLLGALFGLVRGALVAIALLTAYLAFGPRADPKTAPSAVLHSQIAPILMDVSGVFVDAAPVKLKRAFREVYADAQLQLNNTVPSGTNGAAKKDGTK